MLHTPRIQIVTPEPNDAGVTPSVLTSVLVDGKLWPVDGYTIHGNVDGIQTVTLTVAADVTVTHPDAP